MARPMYGLRDQLPYKIDELLEKLIYDRTEEDKKALIEELVKAFSDIKAFGITNDIDNYYSLLNKLIAAQDKLEGTATVASLLDEIHSLDLNSSNNTAKENLIKKLQPIWDEAAIELKNFEDEKNINDFLQKTQRIERQTRQIYSKTQEIAKHFSKMEQGQEATQKYYTFFFMNSKGTQISKVVTIANEQFEQFLEQQNAFKLNLALYKKEKREEHLQSGQNLFQRLGYSATLDENFAQQLINAGGEIGLYNRQDKPIMSMNEIQKRYSQLLLANERGIIRNTVGEKIDPNRMAEMLLYDEVFEALESGQGYQFNTFENMGAIFGGDYEQYGISASIKTGKGKSKVQLMDTKTGKIFSEIFKDADTFKEYAERSLEGIDTLSQSKSLSKILSDDITKELSKVGQQQDLLASNFDKIIKNNASLRALGITSDAILQHPDFQKIYEEARASGYSQGLSNDSKTFLDSINKNKEGFYTNVVKTYIEEKRNPKTGEFIKRIQKWQKDYGYGTDQFSINFEVPTELEISDQLTDMMHPSIDEESNIDIVLPF